MTTSTRSFTAYLLVVSLAMPAAPARGETIGTDVALTGDRERIAAILEREEARAQLLAHGVDAGEAKARVAALTDEEVAQLAARIDEVPAGGNQGTGLVAAVTLVMLVGAAAVLLIVGAVVAGIVAAAKRAR